VSWIRIFARPDRMGGVATELLDMTSVPLGVVTLTESCDVYDPDLRPAAGVVRNELVPDPEAGSSEYGRRKRESTL
jgi:exopolyphosphatase/guanosine-5'-triphosphate,3'-diphosphate pyrophosphatase